MLITILLLSFMWARLIAVCSESREQRVRRAAVAVVEVELNRNQLKADANSSIDQFDRSVR